jgi:hypothetical protein
MAGNPLIAGRDPNLSYAEVALENLVREILDDSVQRLDWPGDLFDAVELAQDALRRERQRSDALQAQLRGMQLSKSWKLTQLLSLAKRRALPHGSLRWKLARMAWRLARAAGGRRLAARVVAAPSAVAARQRPQTRLVEQNTRRQIADLAERKQPGQSLFIFVPSVPWDMHLFQRPQHLARHLAQQGHLVVYDCTNLPQDIDGLVELEPNLFLFKGDVEHLAGLPDPILWTFTYNFAMRDRYPRKCRVVYDWIDDLAVFPFDQAMLDRNHRRALRESTIVVSVARRLHESAARSRPDAIYLPNAVEFDRFARPAAEASDDPILQKMLAERKPIAGYYGALASWFDYDLLNHVAGAKPDWNFLLIGPDYDGSIPGHPLLKRRNVKWVGPRPYATLPAYLKAMTCALIPFKINDITLATSPLKLYEYMAAGKPVITTEMPECMAHPEVLIADSPQSFARLLDEALKEAADLQIVERNRAVGRDNSWTARATTVMTRLAALAQVSHFENTANRGFFRALTGFFAPVSDGPCFRMYFEFALTSNERGQAVAATIAQHASLEGKRYLDIGCAYGGFLVAFAAHGAIVQGLDRDPSLLALARKNLDEQGIDAPLLNIDATSSAFAERFASSLEVVTCNDVIEHVADPQALVANLSTAIRPGGCLYLEIPNKDYAPYIVEDGHFRLFGITLLEHDDAKAYYRHLNPKADYTVGHYLTLPQYFAMLEDAGFEATLLDQCVDYSNLETSLAAVETLRQEGATRLEQVPEAQRPIVAQGLGRYLEQIDAMPRGSAEEERAFRIRYAVSFWQILARRKAPTIAS